MPNLADWVKWPPYLLCIPGKAVIFKIYVFTFLTSEFLGKGARISIFFSVLDNMQNICNLLGFKKIGCTCIWDNLR